MMLLVKRNGRGVCEKNCELKKNRRVGSLHFPGFASVVSKG